MTDEEWEASQRKAKRLIVFAWTATAINVVIIAFDLVYFIRIGSAR